LNVINKFWGVVVLIDLHGIVVQGIGKKKGGLRRKKMLN